MTLSDESKSTILYYIKEGLLSEPDKPKPNVHLYDESCVQRLKFIKYLQHNFSYTIAEIQTIFQNNQFDFDGSFEMIVRSLELISGSRDNKWYSKEDFLELLSISEEILKRYHDKAYLFKRAKGYSSKELKIVEILQKAEKLGLDVTLLDAYVSSAQQLAQKENEVGALLLEHNHESHDARYELLFELVLTLKPYIFNFHTVQTHQNNIKGKTDENTF